MASATRAAAESNRRAVENDIEARLEALAPRIVVYFDGSSMMARIAIQNAGNGSAENLHLEFDPPLQSTHAQESLRFFDTSHPMVPPGYKHAQTFDTWPQYLESDLPKRYQVTARYRGAENKRDYEVRYILDAEAMRWQHIRQSETKLLREEVEKAGKAMQDELRKLGNEILPMMRLQALVRPAPSTLSAAVHDLLGTWHLLQCIDDEPRAFYSPKSMLELLRLQALSTVRVLSASSATEDQKAAIHHLLPVLFSIEAEFLANKEWHACRDQAFERLGQAFSESPDSSDTSRA
ncbi:MAG TPA: hypothetical protein VGR37_13165 [Longimicrobiaceae bacterium]|nr:hypothetical protein [Longimicrobiaceae bacterium]